MGVAILVQASSLMGSLVLLLALAGHTGDVPFDAEHVRLDLAFDETRRSIHGRATETVRLLRDGVEAIDLDADEMRVVAARLADGRPLAFEARPPRLRIALEGRHRTGEQVTFVVEYEATPRRGVYFVGPDARRPHLPKQVWSHSWPEDARYWFPCHDDPADTVTSEMVLTTPATYEAIGNGDLVDVRETAGRKVWHWKMDRPHPTYLVSFVAGEYEEVRDEAASPRVPLGYFVYRGRADDARRTFAHTPEMIRLFSERSGLPYPFAKYSQAVAADFLFGGMENVTAVTLADEALLEPRARADTSSDGVIAHELAHQWWGDAVTVRRWADVWLSEGFATFFQRLWQEHDLGTDAASYQRLLDADDVLALPEGARSRPMVFGDVDDPGMLLNANVYQKGGLVLAMLRHVLGEEVFWRGIQAYAARFAFKSAETADFRRAMEAAAGRDLDWFFDQWTLRPGLPHLTVTHRWDPVARRLVLTVRQDTGADAAKARFVLPLEIRVVTPGGARTEAIVFDQAEQEFGLPCDERPLAVVVDPDSWVPKSLVAEASADELGVRLANGGSAVERAVAARELARLRPAGAAGLLAQALGRDPFWGVRAEAAEALGAFGQTAGPLLQRGAQDADPRVRAALCRALGRMPPSVAEATLLTVVSRDTSELAAAAALRALGTLRSPRAFEALARAMERGSHAERVRIAALEGLGALGDPGGIPLALEQSGPGRASALRCAAIRSLRDLGRSQRVVAGRLTALLEDSDARVREAAAEALGALGDPRTRGRLREALGVEAIPAARRAMDAAVKRIEG
jgi:aminopeptidase N